MDFGSVALNLVIFS